MNLNNFSIRLALAAIGALCGAIVLPSISYANAVLVNNTTICPSSTNSATMSLTPNGDLSITCAASSAPPSCTVTPASSAIGTTQSVTLTANCNPAATSYAWTDTGGGPAMSGASAMLTFPTAGTFTYAVAGTNANGAGALSAAATVAVTAASVAPVCSVAASPTTITAGQTSTLTATCSPTATSYAWTTTGAGAPAIGNNGAVTLAFPAAGTFTYSVIGTNNIGPGAASAAATVQVNASTGCTTSATGAFTGNGIKNLTIDRGNWVSYALPIYTTSGRTLEILSIGSTSSQQDLTSEFSVSTCPGDYTTMQPECRAWGTVNQSGTQLYAAVRGAMLTGTCTVITGQQYYINVRNTKSDYTTPACTPQTCYMILQLNSY